MFALSKLPSWVVKSPALIREKVIIKRVGGQIKWLRFGWDLDFSRTRLQDDLSLAYSDTTHAMERLDRPELFRLLDSKLHQFTEERRKHPGCPNLFIPIENIHIDLLNIQLNWNDKEFEFQKDLNKLYVDTPDHVKQSKNSEYPVNLTVDVFITHGENLDIFSELNMSLASDHINPNANNVKKHFVWTFSALVGHLENLDFKQGLPNNLMDLYVLPNPVKFVQSSGKRYWKVREMNEIASQ